MNLHFNSSATTSRRNPASYSNPVRLGTLALAAIFTATQMPAQAALAQTPQASTQQITDAPAGSAQTPATNTAAAALSAPSGAVRSELNPLPEAPTANAANTESASVTLPPNVRAMMQEATQQNQSLAPKSTSKGIQRPGMLIMGVAGIPLLALGTWIWTRSVSKDSGLKDGLGAAFTVPGALMVGFGFTLAFKPKNK